VNLLLLRGNIGRPGAGVVPVRGHSNVQGDRTVGITEKPGKEFLDQLQQVFGFNPPREHGHDVVHALDAMMRGEAKAFIGLGGNFVAAAPDTPLIYDAFRKLNLTVSVATKLNRTHLPHGRNSFVLPCLARSEIDRTPGGMVQAVTIEDAMSMVQASRGVVAPASLIFVRNHGSLRAWREQHSAISRSFPGSGWSKTTLAFGTRSKRSSRFSRDSMARIKVPSGFRLANAASERIWMTPNGKANFMLFQGLDEDAHQNNPEVLWLSTIRSHDQLQLDHL
jgi:anaerobic selenocysteine-containing dehydrogenase